MDGNLTVKIDNRKAAMGLSVGQRVSLKHGGALGKVIGFAPAFHSGCTVFVRLDNGGGNRGNYHTCGNYWVEAAE